MTRDEINEMVYTKPFAAIEPIGRKIIPFLSRFPRIGEMFTDMGAICNSYHFRTSDHTANEINELIRECGQGDCTAEKNGL